MFKLYSSKLSNLFNKYILYHILFWTLYIFCSLSAIYARAGDQEVQLDFLDISINYLSAITFSYYLFAFSVEHFFTRNVKKGTLHLLTALAIYYSLQYSRVYLASLANELDLIPPYFHNVFTLVFAYIKDIFFFMITATVMYLYNSTVKKSKETINLLEKNQNIELNFLKSQINHHFIFNAINTMYHKAIVFSEPLALNLTYLSQILHYSLNSQLNNFSTLEKEIDIIIKLIHINQYTYDNTLLINLELIKVKENLKIKIPSLILLTIVENAFKHGNLVRDKLDIKIEIENNNLILSTSNLMTPKTKPSTTSIGITNTKRRLELLFRNNFELTTSTNNNYFTLILILKDINSNDKN